MDSGIPVTFTGTGAGEGPLTWGQLQIWQTMRDTGTSQTMGGVVPAGGKTVEDLAAELRFFMSRYASMRTRLRFATDGTPWQVTAGSGEATLEVVDVPDDGEPDAVAQELAEHWEQKTFDYVNEWPIRMGAVRHRGAVTHVVVILCHLAADGAGVAVMTDELSRRDPVTGEIDAPAPGTTPLELAWQQRTPEGQRQSDQALRYWERVLRDVAARRFPGPGEPREPRYWQVDFASRAMYHAARAIAARTTGDVSPVLLAAFAVALARATGTNPVVTQAIISNRFRRGLSELVSPVNENGLYVIDVDDATFDEVVERARRASMNGSKYAYYDPERLDALIAHLGRERGEPIDLGCVFNDRRMGAGRDTDGAPTTEEVHAALAETTLVWERPLPGFDEKLMININDTPGVVDMLVEVDTLHVSPATLDALLRDMEAVTVAAAFDPAVPIVHP